MNEKLKQELEEEKRLRKELEGEMKSLKKQYEASYWEVHDRAASSFVELMTARKKAEKLQEEAHQSQKIEAIGQLAGGIAHEINTPVQYIGDNLKFLMEEQANLIGALKKYRDGVCTLSDVDDVRIHDLFKINDEIDLNFLEEEIPNAIGQSIEGINHVAKLVRSMKEFAHPGSVEVVLVDINRSIETVVNISKNVWKYVAVVEKNLDEKLPHVPCLFSEFNQVLLNIIVNAAHAIEDATRDSTVLGTIAISTCVIDEFVEIQINDTGTGMPEHVRKKIFDPFFTTKEVGKGTGQGLSIAYKLIAEKLNGSIDVLSEVGKGTSFILRLPLNPPMNNDDE